MGSIIYIFHDKEQPGFDFLHRTVECTKAGLGLRLFLVLAALGERGLGEFINSRFDLAKQAHEHIDRQPDFECAVPPQSNILCFRVKGRDDMAQLAIREKLTADGNFYISTVSFGGRRWLRVVFMNPETGMDEIERLIKEIRRLAG